MNQDKPSEIKPLLAIRANSTDPAVRADALTEEVRYLNAALDSWIKAAADAAQQMQFWRMQDAIHTGRLQKALVALDRITAVLEFRVAQDNDPDACRAREIALEALRACDKAPSLPPSVPQDASEAAKAPKVPQSTPSAPNGDCSICALPDCCGCSGDQRPNLPLPNEMPCG